MDDRIQSRIREHYPSLRPSEKKAADYLLGYRGNYGDLRIADVSRKAKVSQPTMIRFVKALGYQGFTEFKNDLMQSCGRGKTEGEKREGSLSLYGVPISPKEAVSHIPGKVIGSAVHMLEETLRSLSEKDYEGAVKAIAGAKRVVVYGVEDSGAVAEDLMVKLLYLGIPCCRYNDFYIQHASALGLGKEDLAIGISYSGTSKPTVELMRRAKKAGAQNVVITNFINAPITRYGDYVLCTSSRQFLRGKAIFSRITQLAIVDMLYMGVFNQNYKACEKAFAGNSRMSARLSVDMGEDCFL